MNVVSRTRLDHFGDHLQGRGYHVSFSWASHWRGEARHHWGVCKDQDLITEMNSGQLRDIMRTLLTYFSVFGAIEHDGRQ
jgi:hypothetical protein